MRFKVLTYNIHHGASSQDEYNLDAIISTVKGAEADIVCLNEVDRGFSNRSNLDDQMVELSEALGMAGAFSVDIERFDETGEKQEVYGNVLLSKFPIVEHENIRMFVSGRDLIGEYQESAREQPRSILKAQLDLGDVNVWVLVTHLTPLVAGERFRQVDRIIDTVNTLNGSLVVLGDFNATPESGELQKLTTVLHNPSAGLGFVTRPDEKAQIDYILTRGIKCEQISVMESKASDHQPLLAVLRVE